MTMPLCRWNEETGNLFEVTYVGQVEVAFDKEPTFDELVIALADNLAYRITSAIEYGYLNHDDLTYEHIMEVPI